MIKCEICNKEFKNNLGGNLTIHIRDCHNITQSDYYVMFNLNGVEPKCECGCGERPFFHRNKFSKYTLNHDNNSWLESKFIKEYGAPKCKNSDCNNNVNFYRGKPRIYCSQNCSEKCQENRWNQEKVKNTVKEKYGVDNVFQLDSVKYKAKQTMIRIYGVEHAVLSPQIQEKIKETNIKRYGVEFPQNLKIFKDKQKSTMLLKYNVTHYSKTKKFRELASLNMCKYNENIYHNHKIKIYKDTKIYYQSLYEYHFLEYCEKMNLLKYVDNSPRFKYLETHIKYHIPDFKFKDKYIIEIKSSYWLNRQGGVELINLKKSSVEREGYEYIFLLDENFENFNNIIN